LLSLFSGKSTRTKDTAINLHWIHCELQTFKRNRNKHILHTNWCEIHSSDLWSCRWSEKYSDSDSRIWFMHEESRNVTNSKLDWAVFLTARYARRNRKTVHLGARLRKPPKAVADLLGNHEGDIPGDGSRSIRPRDLGSVLCKQAKTVENACWPTLGSDGNRSWQEYCGICTDAQIMSDFKVASSKSSPLWI